MLIESQSAIEMLEWMPFEMAIKYSSAAHNEDEHNEKWNSNEKYRIDIEMDVLWMAQRKKNTFLL